ncbi:MAG: 50S ribosomal protein L22 [Candidatus Harrisonbacteria bacterium RIFCSPHIGHO2_01_FULL_44_13]|uniref:Large ribosomal subunit protein uL22 n=1 Tax=Candidatus Harrisonbacteria bacterium RIFCSPLOWO2_01_FULL_44_18 TaxID=1798407 RepID=A0A1G1ZNF4_9BACT|nr:MAG: 50S ribosomal protein L22 [Candidatus Harrisonbacteria bacterium RIFCSPHIGHO2_01_FULL_44_13]OGY65949.1 MAG: 50S ribosomal protein L22 [Candidatus Harrisonbacteria bacterium RIFCSPLOWO2_01_FULL_44_18]
MKQIAKLKYLHMAPRKVRLIADTLKGLPISEAEAQLLTRSQRVAGPLLKLLRSAIANAKNNAKLDSNKLFVESIRVDQGPMLKRILPRAQGRTTPIQKKMSHITVVLEEAAAPTTPRFTIAPPPKKEKKTKKSAVKKPALREKKEEITKKPEKAGFFKRLFRRKSV